MASDEEERKKELRRKIEYQVACEEKAFRIVERLIENPITEQFLLDALQFITPNHYSDVVEERAISKLCGYPICGKQLTNIPKQKYTISTKTNKVYDIESKKNFCSGKCYKASMYLEKQISSSPVWSRKKQPPIRYELLPLDGKRGLVGDEVKLSIREELKEDLNKLGRLDRYQEALKKNQEKDKSLSDVNIIKHDRDGRPVPGDKDAATDDELKKFISNSVNETNQNLPDSTAAINKLHRRGSDDDDDDECVYTLERTLEEMKFGSVYSESESGITETRVANQNDHESNLYKDVEQIPKEGSNSSYQTRTRTTFLEKVKDAELEAQDIKIHSGKELDIHSAVPNMSLKSDSLKTERDKSVSEASTQNQDEQKDTNKTEIKPVPGESKTDYLMKLLDKRKSLLAKMVDIQPVAVAGQEPVKQVTSTDGLKVDHNTVKYDEHTNVDNEIKSCIQEISSVIIQDGPIMPCDKEIFKKGDQVEDINFSASNNNVVPVNTPNDERGSICETVIVESTGNLKYHSKVKENTETSENQLSSTQDRLHSIKPDRKEGNVSTLQLICKTIQAWMTVESLQYLNTKEESAMKSELEKKYKALEAKIDKQERDFDEYLGEEVMSKEDSSGIPSAPLPHFEDLKKEVEDDTVRVREYLKGSFTYTVEERESNQKKDSGTDVVLPSVDRYDQMLIRHRIVLDRISKVLPDLLSPLHLLVQHVFTDVRELVFTFNLTKDNILFKPAEWILVTLMLLKLISGRNSSVRSGFDTPEATKYFTVVLRGVHSSLEELNTCAIELKNPTNQHQQ